MILAPYFFFISVISRSRSFASDTIILNAKLPKKAFVESGFQEQEIAGEKNLLLTFNHIKRYFDTNGNIVKADTLQMDRIDYAFNALEKNTRTRVATHPTVKCTFAGYIPREIITTNRTISVQRPAEDLRRIWYLMFIQITTRTARSGK